MIKCFFITLLLIGFSVNIYSQSVGINTINPQRAFHIDPQGNNETGGAGIYDDDIVIDQLNTGNMAIGSRSAPTNAKVTVAIPSVFRMQDGTGVEGRVITSDANGNAYWGNIVGANGIVLARLRINSATGAANTNITTNVALPQSQFTARLAGLYFFEIRFWAMFTAAPRASFSTTYHIELRNSTNNTLVPGAEYEHYHTIQRSNADQGVGFFTVLSAQLAAGQQVHITSRITVLPNMKLTPNETITAPRAYMVPYSNDSPFAIIVKHYNIR